MELQRARDWADLALKICSIGALIAGGFWAYFQFTLVGTTELNLQLVVSGEVLRYDSDAYLLIVHARPKNIGKVRVELPKKGFIVTVHRLSERSGIGPINLENLPEVAETDILQRFPDGYLLEPGVEYDELFAVVVPSGKYAAKAVLSLGEHDELDHTAIVTTP